MEPCRRQYYDEVGKNRSRFERGGVRRDNLVFRHNPEIGRVLTEVPDEFDKKRAKSPVGRLHYGGGLDDGLVPLEDEDGPSVRKQISAQKQREKRECREEWSGGFLWGACTKGRGTTAPSCEKRVVSIVFREKIWDCFRETRFGEDEDVGSFFPIHENHDSAIFFHET